MTFMCLIHTCMRTCEDRGIPGMLHVCSPERKSFVCVRWGWGGGGVEVHCCSELWHDKRITALLVESFEMSFSCLFSALVLAHSDNMLKIIML